jgi:hypothetical protein
MKEVTFPHEHASWDRYKAFFTICLADGFNPANPWTTESPIILFDTGEVICTASDPGPDVRYNYRSIGVTLTTTKEQRLFFPDADDDAQIPLAWLDDAGMQYLLVDHETRHVVRLNGPYRHQPQNPDRFERPPAPVTAGIPHRFQYNCRAYIPGPGLPPVSHVPLKVSIPIAKAGYTSDEIEHVQMIVNTGRAAMKLTDHEALHRNPGTKGVNPDTLLECKTWQDVPEALLPALAQHGAGRVERSYPYLLSERP